MNSDLTKFINIKFLFFLKHQPLRTKLFLGSKFTYTWFQVRQGKLYSTLLTVKRIYASLYLVSFERNGSYKQNYYWNKITTQQLPLHFIVREKKLIYFI